MHVTAIEDWQAQHRPPDPDDDVGAPLHEIDKVMPDFHEHPEWYVHGEPGSHESVAAAMRAKGNPDAKVRIYRSLPAEHAHKGFQPGDWVSTAKDYARGHGTQEDPKHDWPVIRTTVRAGDLWTHGDSVNEFGYHGPHKPTAMVAFKGGHHQEVRQHADGVVRAVQRRQAVQEPPEGLTFKHKERDSGGTRWPHLHNIFAYGPDSETNVGNVSYFTHPRRKTLYIDGLNVHPQHQRQGIGSALMDEVQRRHPDHAIDHGDRTDDGKAWWGGYTEGKPVRRGRTAAADWSDPGHKPGFVPAPEGADDDEHLAHYDRQRAIHDHWESGIRHGLGMGRLTNEEAEERGYRGSGHDRDLHTGAPNWKPLPHTLYHVTTNLPSVREHGLKSRDELSQDRGKGLGGGESDTISYTEDPKIARDIHHSLGEFHDVVTGKVTPHDLVARARKGDMGSTPFEAEMRKSGIMDVDRVLRGKQHLEGTFKTQADMDAEHGPGVATPHPTQSNSFEAPKGTVHTRWERDSTPEEHREDAASLYKTFAGYREIHGGHPDPLFFNTDVHGLAATKREDHGIVKVHAKPGAHGYQLRALGEWRSPTGDNVEIDHEHDPHTAAARPLPSKRVFGPTYGLDKRLWEPSGDLKPDVRTFLLRKVGSFLTSHFGPGWQDWARIYFAGSEASMWTGPELVGNSDFDTLIGINYPVMRKAVPQFAHASNARITDILNDELRHQLRDPAEVIPIDGQLSGPYDATFFVNPDSWDIRKIRPYAAFDVGADTWAVKPPDLPDWSLADFPKPVVNALKAAERYARDVLKLPEPQRTQQGAALFDAWHSDRSRAFSPHGHGWYDFANLREKWLDQQGVWGQLVDAKHRDDQGLGMVPDWSNTPTWGKHAVTDRWPPYLTEREDEYGDSYPVNESRHNPRGPVGTESDARAAGLAGPYFHGTHKRRARDIRQNGFRQPRMHNWEMGDAGGAEEVDLGHTHRTFFTEKHEDALNFAQAHHGDDADVVKAYLHPDHLTHEEGGGWMPSVQVKDVAHAVAIQEGRKTAVGPSRLERAWGSHDESTLFGDGPTAPAPWPGAGRRKDKRDYDRTLVDQAVHSPEHHHMQDVDPRTLHATQPSVTRSGVRHYLTDHYDRTGETFADHHSPGNRRPVVYQREDGQNLILSGHHRATAALLQGRPLQALVVNGPWGEAR